MVRRRSPPRVLTVAGSDSGGGAGIQADLKTFAAHGVYGASVVTAVTAQNTVRVTAVHDVPADVVSAQLDAVFDDLGTDGTGIGAVKIGMLSSAELVRTVARALERRRPAHVVLDPVMVAKSGDALLRDDAVDVLRSELLPLATVVTPNLPEAERLLGREIGGLEAREAAARELARHGPAVLLKGGHGTEDPVVDLLVTPEEAHAFRHPRLETSSSHGTGCTLSSALAARLALGVPLPDAARGAVDYLHAALRAAYPVGHGHGPVDHLHCVSPCRWT